MINDNKVTGLTGQKEEKKKERRKRRGEIVAYGRADIESLIRGPRRPKKEENIHIYVWKIYVWKYMYGIYM